MFPISDISPKYDKLTNGRGVYLDDGTLRYIYYDYC